MAEPGILPLRSPHALRGRHARGDPRRLGRGARRTARSTSATAPRSRRSTGSKGAFAMKLADGDTVEAEAVVLAIGLQGNLRKLGVPGEDLPFVQYQLDDPDEYADETIVVVGAGDAAIENAIALSSRTA